MPIAIAYSANRRATSAWRTLAVNFRLSHMHKVLA